MLVRISVLAGFIASLLAISTANAERPQRDLSYRNPNNGQTYGFVQCRWKSEPRVRETAGSGGMRYAISNAKAECLPEGGVGAYVTSADWTQIDNVRCDSKNRNDLSVVFCLRQHAGRLEARDGYFTFVHPNPASQPSQKQRESMRRNSSH